MAQPLSIWIPTQMIVGSSTSHVNVRLGSNADQPTIPGAVLRYVITAMLAVLLIAGALLTQHDATAVPRPHGVQFAIFDGGSGWERVLEKDGVERCYFWYRIAFTGEWRSVRVPCSDAACDVRMGDNPSNGMRAFRGLPISPCLQPVAANNRR